jgi:hypothetical protein
MVIFTVHQSVDLPFDFLEIQPFAASTVHPNEKRVVVAVESSAFRVPSYDVGGGKFTSVDSRNV